MTAPLPSHDQLVPPTLQPGGELVAAGRALARDWTVGRNAFLNAQGVASEAEYKRREALAGRVMQHAHIGFRSVERTVAAIAEVHAACARHGARVDRFGITLDMSMGYPPHMRKGSRRGTGIVLEGAESFACITNAAPAAAHFGDFMLGLPGALENTKGALAAGATAIGNLGQYFTFRLPDWDDDVATTHATVTALGLIAVQPVEVLVHSNLDDGFAGLFADMSSALGMVLVEKHIVETLIGARLSHCFGHHFTAPLVRMAFHAALAQVTDTPGTMIFGNTVSYKSTPAGNYASLASYLQADIWALGRRPTGHAVNPVPVTENERIPDIDEIIDAQLFAHRLAAHAAGSASLIDRAPIDALADRLVEGGRLFASRVLAGLAEAGIDTVDPAQMMLALRRIGPKRLEAAFGAGVPEATAWSGRRPVVQAEWVDELEHAARNWAGRVPVEAASRIAARGFTACVASSDVHEHGKNLVERTLGHLGIATVDGGTSVDADDLVAAALAAGADIIAISTYNGIALRYAREVTQALTRAGASIPVCIGGRLNQVPEDSNSGLPIDVTADIAALGVVPCLTPIALIDHLTALIDQPAATRSVFRKDTR
ncbi:methylmalonyl-CoA mutase cobalamin-binding subunit [Angulomicrobium tetraedrale]|uniref:Methylmalonyl-CoA mutase cobalamin-binding subunit n=1 Tax=Ancylobacter tetraedralis TaxID=217068 RepID=A0A839Z7R2_9HYPH|nr:cobalamin-dependent protein [Ancylobacter tetraedralis]MBB3770145.1 methylmalonyl-CoA mutase cobalamin-binding subunit [Ancylobacter tetraedralis]